MYEIKSQLEDVREARQSLLAWGVAFGTIALLFGWSGMGMDGAWTQSIFTLLHEAGHALVAEVLGGNATEIVVHDNGGFTAHTTPSGRIRLATVTAAGLLAAPTLAAILATTHRWPRIQRGIWLLLIAVFSIFILPICRSTAAFTATIIVISMMFILVFMVGDFFRQYLSGLIIFSLLGSAFQARHYLFASVTGLEPKEGQSDVAAIAEHLAGPPIMWSIFLLAIILGLTWYILWTIYRTADVAVPHAGSVRLDKSKRSGQPKKASRQASPR